ncbi:Mor transcription activator family protein [Lactiplantibacillus dongliensis]|uniref:Mor transcription activator family protein n=1 Tax=Lactiplantibacillus dongliensis TaxID=2559919 RepID=A0ABW1R7M0_9LACO|nr:Mor transcription activator family protein [Lactiplantibacillus dongliensis]
MPIKVAALNSIYADLYEIVGPENVEKIFRQQRGIQVTFPTHLYDRTKLVPIIRMEAQNYNVRELARMYGYSERWVRRVLKSATDEFKEGD